MAARSNNLRIHATDQGSTSGAEAFAEAIQLRLRRFHADQTGVTATEYVVLVVLVICALIFIISVFGERIHNLYQQAVDTLHRDVRL